MADDILEGPALNRAQLIERLRACADDPMWANHAEVSKATLRAAADALANSTDTHGVRESPTPDLSDAIDKLAHLVGWVALKAPDNALLPPAQQAMDALREICRATRIWRGGHEMSKPKLTPWFNGREKPARPGVYLATVLMQGDLDDTRGLYRYWNGKNWCKPASSAAGAAAPEMHKRAFFRITYWRGRANPARTTGVQGTPEPYWLIDAAGRYYRNPKHVSGVQGTPEPYWLIDAAGRYYRNPKFLA